MNEAVIHNIFYLGIALLVIALIFRLATTVAWRGLRQRPGFWQRYGYRAQIDGEMINNPSDPALRDEYVRGERLTLWIRNIVIFILAALLIWLLL